MLERLSIRWRLALISAALTFIILCIFAVVMGSLTATRIRSDFNNEIEVAANNLKDKLSTRFDGTQVVVRTPLELYAASSKNAVARILNYPSCNQVAPKNARPDIGCELDNATYKTNGYRVANRVVSLHPEDSPSDFKVTLIVQYARKVSDLEATIGRVRAFLAFGAIAGTLMALLGGLALAKRSLRPIAAITSAARTIARTRDPRLKVPQPEADDEVGELARTFDEMLESLEGSRQESEEALQRQREFVADASHELRTPLTSVLANLELLTDELEGEPREAAEAALRSSRRMRRLVADLLLLARSDAGREQPHRPVDLGSVARDAVAEATALAAGHELLVEAEAPVVVEGARDELHRLVLNLVENAVSHTPPGTTVHVRVTGDDVEGRLIVEDDGPGVPPAMHEKVFERFVRASGDRGGSTGLGLAIVRAVARAHGGDVVLEDAGPGARFVVTLPRVEGEPSPETDEHVLASAPGGSTATRAPRRAAAFARGLTRRPGRRD